MSKSVVLMAVLLAVECLAAPATAGVTKEQLDTAIAKLIANAELWAKDNNIPTNDLADLGSLKFDKESAQAIIAALRGIKRNTEGLYATARLLERLQSSDLETIRAVIPEVYRIQMQARGLYRPFPTMTKAQVEALNMPPYTPNLTTAQIMTRMGSLEAMRAAKKQRDLVPAKQNEAAWDNEQAAYKLLAAGGSQRDDSRAMVAMSQAERTGNGIFIIILEAYQAAAPKMEPARATGLYRVLRPTAMRLRMQPNKSYTLKGKSLLRPDVASEMGSINALAGSRMLGLLNTLAGVAKNKNLATIKVPTQKEIDEFNQKRK